MSTLTPNYSLVKPDPTEVADVTVLNSNTDIIDTELRNREIEAVTAHTRVRYNGTRSVDLDVSSPGVEYQVNASSDLNLVDILDQDLLNLAPVSIKRFNLSLFFEASRLSGSGEVLFDMEVAHSVSEGPGFVPGGSLISYGRIDEGASFSTSVDERAFDDVSETLVGVGKVSGTFFRTHEYMFTAVPANASNQLNLSVTLHAGGVAMLVRNIHSKLYVEW